MKFSSWLNKNNIAQVLVIAMGMVVAWLAGEGIRIQEPARSWLIILGGGMVFLPGFIRPMKVMIGAMDGEKDRMIRVKIITAVFESGFRQFIGMVIGFCFVLIGELILQRA